MQRRDKITFDFQNLIVYQKAKVFHLKVWSILESTAGLTRANRDQLDRASLSIALNIAEGTGRFSRRGRRNFYVIARSSALECGAILDILGDKGVISNEVRGDCFGSIDELSKMLFSMIRKLEG